jgi:arylsulfatase A-like enzyme
MLSRIVALIALLASDLAAFAAERKPNIVIILSDDMGFSDIGCYGGEIRTPNLDALAAGGLRFTQFYNTARCCPTRASLLTGLYSHQAGIGHMMDDSGLPGYRGRLNFDTPTIAEVLKPAGYRTYMTGKWHVGGANPKPNGPKDTWPLQRGFEKFYGTIEGGGSYYDPTSLCRGNTFITPENDAAYKPATFYYTDAITDNALKFLEQHARESSDQPFFLYVAYTAAHWPMHALPEDIAKYHGAYVAGYDAIRAARFERAKKLGVIDGQTGLSPTADSWEKVGDKAWEARCMEVYAAMVDRMDQGIGRLVAALKASGQLEHTLIFYLQDNGGCAEGMGRKSNAEQIKDKTYKPFAPDDLQPQIWPPMQTRDGRAVRTGPGVMPGPADTYIAYGRAWANVSNTPFREYKHWVHEGGISTPLIVHWPDGIAARGELRQQPAHLVDLMATCVDVAGAAFPTEFGGEKTVPLEGLSLRPSFGNNALTRDAIYWKHEGNRAIRVADWKLVAKGPKSPWELYDLAADRSELHDLASVEPERVQAMSAKWDAWAARCHVESWPLKKSRPGPEAKPASSRSDRCVGARARRSRAGQRVALDRSQGARLAQGKAGTGTGLLDHAALPA